MWLKVIATVASILGGGYVIDKHLRNRNLRRLTDQCRENIYHCVRERKISVQSIASEYGIYESDVLEIIRRMDAKKLDT